MKITTSFSPPMGTLAPLLAAVTWGTALLAGVITLWLVPAAVEMRQEIPALEERLTEIEGRQKETVMSEVLPSVEDLALLKRRVAEINELLGGRGWPLSVLLETLEESLPARAYLVSMEHKRNDGEAQLIAEAESAETLTGFLLNLEREDHFAEVLLTKQVQRTAQGRKLVQFELRVKERPL